MDFQVCQPQKTRVLCHLKLRHIIHLCLDQAKVITLCRVKHFIILHEPKLNHTNINKKLTDKLNPIETAIILEMNID